MFRRLAALILASVSLSVLATAWTVAGAQENTPIYNSLRLTAAMPENREFPGYKTPTLDPEGDSKAENARQACVILDARRTSDDLYISVRVAVFRDAKVAETAIFGLIPSSAPTPPEKTVSGRRIGQRAWARADGHVMYVVDGRAGVAILMRPRVRLDAERRPYIASPTTQEDILFCEEIAIKTLARMQAMGVTSKPAAAAPEWAKKQTGERLEKIARAARGEPVTP
jgi:hypothetical protein